MNQDVSSRRLHQEHLEWLTKKQMYQQEKLAATKKLVAQYPDFDEAKELINGIQTDVAYCENVLEYLKKKFNQQSDCNESRDKVDVDVEDNDFSENKDDKFAQDDSMQRDPMDMLHPKYKGISMFEIIDSILNDTSKELSSEDVTKIAYDTNSDLEFERAKASMAAQLRIGASKGKWAKVGRGCFASNIVVEQQQNSNRSTTINFDAASANNGYFHEPK